MNLSSPGHRIAARSIRSSPSSRTAAGIFYLPCPDAGDEIHGKCTPACHRYSFHDERRAFATLNAPNMTRESLQVLMRHRSPDTTDRYINMARQLNPAVSKLHVPSVQQQAE